MIISIKTTKGTIESPKYPDTWAVENVLNEKIKELEKMIFHRKEVYLKIDNWTAYIRKKSFYLLKLNS